MVKNSLSKVFFILLFLNIIFATIGYSADEFRSPESSFISGVSYDAKKRTLSVDMYNKNSQKQKQKQYQYQYQNVDKETFEKFKKAESKGQFFNKSIKDHYDYKRTK